ETYDRWVAWAAENILSLAAGLLVSAALIATGSVSPEMFWQAGFLAAWPIFFILHFAQMLWKGRAPPKGIWIPALLIAGVNAALLLTPLSLPIIFIASFVIHWWANQILSRTEISFKQYLRGVFVRPWREFTWENIWNPRRFLLLRHNNLKPDKTPDYMKIIPRIIGLVLMYGSILSLPLLAAVHLPVLGPDPVMTGITAVAVPLLMAAAGFIGLHMAYNALTPWAQLATEAEYDPVYGERMYQTMPHRISFGIVGSSIENIQKALEFVKKEMAQFPGQHKPGRIILGVTDAGLLANLPADLVNECHIVVSEKADTSDLLFKFRDKAFYADNATILSVISDEMPYRSGDMVKNIKALMYHNKPSVISSAGRKPSSPVSGAFPVDLTFYTDAHYVRARHAEESFLDQIRPYLIVNQNAAHANRVVLDALPAKAFSDESRWKKSDASTHLLTRVHEQEGGEFLISDSRILVFEPHADDAVLGAGILLKRWLSRNNRLWVYNFTSRNEHDYWPQNEEMRDFENRLAFQRIREIVEKETGPVEPIGHQTLDFTRPDAAAAQLQLELEIKKVLRALESRQPDAIVVPAEEDTHRHHIRMRELVLLAAKQYVRNTGKRIRIYSVPLFSSESKAYKQTNRTVLLSPEEQEEKRYVLDAYLSQGEYVQGVRYAQWIGKNRERTGGLQNECFLEEELSPETAQKDAPEVWNMRKSGLGGLEIQTVLGGKEFRVGFDGESGRIEIYQEGFKDGIPPISVIDEILNRLLEQIMSLDPRRDMVFERRWLKNPELADPLHELTGLLQQYGELQGIPALDHPTVVAGLKVLFEKISGEVEEIKLRQGLLDQKINLDSDIYEQRLRQSQKLIIGIPSHNSGPVIAEKLKNIAGEIRRFPETWRAWEIELVICVNGRPAGLDAMARETAMQIPADMFAGIKNPLKITIIKSLYPNQGNAMNEIHTYARRSQGTIIFETDDDVHLETGSMTTMITSLLSIEKKALVSSRYYWRRRPLPELYQESLDGLQSNPFTRIMPGKILAVLAQLAVPMKSLWQEIAIFRMRPDIPFSPQDVMGAANVTWTDHFIGLPYWIRQTDVWWRYRYAPFARVEDKARSSGVAARSLGYYLSKRPRSVYGYHDDINYVFSNARRREQKEGYIHYLQNMRETGLGSLAVRDKLFLFLSIFFFEGSTWLISHFGWIFRSPIFIWNASERGADARPIAPGQGLLPLRAAEPGCPWQKLEITSRSATYFGFGAEGISSMQVLLQPAPALPAEQALAENFQNRMRQILEAAQVDEHHRPVIPALHMDSLLDQFGHLDGQKHSRSFSEKTLRVFSALYAIPDVRAAEIMEWYGIDQEELISIYRFIRGQTVFQELFRAHPVYRNFYHRMRGLLADADFVQTVLDRTTEYPQNLEIHPSPAPCNSNCLFCYNHGHRYYEEAKAGIKPLPVDLWLKVIDEGARHGLRRLDIVGGFEPLMTLDSTLAIIERAKAKGIEIRLFTNGISLDPQNAEMIRILGEVDHLYVSMRGITYDTYRKVAGVSEDDFHNIFRGVEILAQEKKKQHSGIKISFLINHLNYHELEDMLMFAKKTGSVSVGLSTDNVEGMQHFTPRQVQEVQSALVRVMRDIEKGVFKPMEISFNDTLLKLWATCKQELPPIYQYQLRDPRQCLSRFFEPTVNPFGKIFHCCALAQPKYEMRPFDQITPRNLLGDAVRNSWKKDLQVGKCRKCNPASLSGIMALEKFSDDAAAGIALNMQPFDETAEKEGKAVQEPEVGQTIVLPLAPRGGLMPWLRAIFVRLGMKG
ncbi:radical SAM protein, partial [candidate division FCPU426 bacterium]|nr:radical SAM protein [candidate division FCPU426 bacterium]